MSSPSPILGDRSARLRVRLGAAAVLVLVGLVVAVLVLTAPRAETVREVEPSAAVVSAAPEGLVLVHLLGAVVKPGLYELREGDRAVDAVAAAGGFTPEADAAGINLARIVADGEQIVVPVLGAVPASVPPGSPADGLVDLNTADAASLDTLPGVGPATAQAILDWRDERGRFASIEDLMSVSGIGEKTFAALEDLVRV